MANVNMTGGSRWQREVARRAAAEFDLPNEGQDILADGGLEFNFFRRDNAGTVIVKLLFRTTAEAAERIMAPVSEPTPTEVELRVIERPTVREVNDFLQSSGVPDTATITINRQADMRFLIKARWEE